MSVPATLTAGDTWSFLVEAGTHAATDGWSVTFVAYNASQRFTFDSTAEGQDHRLERTAAQSSGIIPGDYEWVAFGKKAGEREQIVKGRITITPNVEAARPFDTRSTARQILAELEAAYLSYVQSTAQGASLIQSYTIGDRSTTFHAPTDFITAINYWQNRVALEEAAESVAQGLGNPRRFYVRFDG